MVTSTVGNSIEIRPEGGGDPLSSFDDAGELAVLTRDFSVSFYDFSRG